MLSFAIAALLTHVTAHHAQTTEPRLLRTPDIYGDTVVFSYAGDLWVTKTDGNAIARRLTSHPGNETRPRISPDGKWVAFTGSYDGSQNIYVIPIEGGEPKRLTYSTEGDVCLGWTPDGKVSFATTAGNVVPDQASLWIVDPHGGAPQPTAIKEISSGRFFADGHRIAYTRANSFNFNWRKYRGGTQGRVSIYDLDTNKYSELPSGREQSYHPMPVGEDIYYISDRGTGTLNLFRHHGDRDEKLTNFTTADIRFPSTDGKKVVFEDDGYLYTYAIADGSLTKLSPQIDSENLASRPALRNLTPFISGISISPSGTRVAVEARGEIFSVPAKHGETRNMTRTSGVRERAPQWSPDGKSIAYVSDASGENEIYIQPQLGGEAKQLTHGGTYKFQGASWTPDSKSILILTTNWDIHLVDVATGKDTLVDHCEWGLNGLDVSANSQYIAYSKGVSAEASAIYIWDSKTGTKQQVTKGYYSDTDVAFDQSGNYLYFISDRTFVPTPGIFEPSLKIEQASRLYAIALNPSVPNPYLEKDEEEGAAPEKPAAGEIKLDLTNADQRTIALPFPVSQYARLVGAQGGFFVFSQGVLWKFDMGSPAPQPIYTGLPAAVYDFNPSRSKVAVLLGSKIQVLDVNPGLNPGAEGIDTSNIEATIDYIKEYKQIYWDSWRYIRDAYYDPGMRGMDWLVIGKRYEAYLPYVHHREDLNYVIGLLLGELGTGHSYITARGDNGFGGQRIPVGYLGADYEIVGDSVRFKKILIGRTDKPEYESPLGEPGLDVKSGEYLLAIDGVPVNRFTNPASLLVGKVGKVVTLTVNSVATSAGSRKVRVRPVATEANIRYADWVERNRQLVNKLSGGRIGYMHIRDTAEQGSADFVEGFYPQASKDALLVDERWNHGGYPQPWFVNTLARKPQSYAQQRGVPDVHEAPSNDGPKAMLINQYAGSGGDFFPYMFRKNGLGPLIGTRTWGGLVGINEGFGLIDGGRITAPSFSLYNPDTNEIVAENTGIEPDIDVDLSPELLAAGRDPQLEAGVKYLLDQLSKLPPKKKRVEIPHVAPKGKIGSDK